MPDAGAAVDAEIPPAQNADVVSINSGTGGRQRRSKKDDPDANTTPPDVSEWQDFFGRVVIRAATDWYLDQAFNGVEHLVTEREADSLELNDEERHRMAKPFAELAMKLKWTRKHGRTIIAATGSFESMIMLGKWVARVNRISAKYKRTRKPAPSQTTIHPQSPPPPPQQEERGPEEDVYVRPPNSPPPTAAANGSGSGYSLLNPGTG